MKQICTYTALALFLLSTHTPVWAQKTRVFSLQKTFKELKVALQKKQIKRFKKYWYSKGFEKNIVGPSGLSGTSVYRQGSRKVWHLKPVLRGIRWIKKEKIAILPCLIWSSRRKRAVDKIQVALIRMKTHWLVLGGGESFKEVKQLAKKYIHQTVK